MEHKRFLAADLGAESGRVVVGTLQEGRVSMEEMHRFANEPVELCGTLHWDVLSLYNNVLKGMRTAAERFGGAVDGIGIDTWAVDFGLLAADGSLLQNPVCYRDKRTDGIPEVVKQRMPEKDLYAHTGIFLLPIYTLSQMVALRESGSPVLECSDGFLMMPDLLAYFLCGERACERTNAISTQLYDPRRGRWHPEVFEAFDLPLAIMPDLIDPGTILGEIRDSVAAHTGLTGVEVIAPCTHDTGSAVAAVPGAGDDWAFLSSGTWSILGSLTDEVVTTGEALDAGLCNELTLDSFFLCQNIMGLWLLQQARASWEAGGNSYSYPELVEIAEAASPSEAMLDPNDESFMAPDDMPEAIRAFCRRTDQPRPEGPAEMTRLILESLALSYRYALDRIAGILDRTYRTLHIVGGGSLNTLLCQLTADATGLAVKAGPVEATVMGNLLVQAYAGGFISSPEEIRRIAGESAEMRTYQPRERSRWEDRYGEYRRLLEG